MSAPDTNIETEKRRHRPALLGIALASSFAALLLTGFLVYVVDKGGAPQGAEMHIDGRLGVETE